MKPGKKDGGGGGGGGGEERDCYWEKHDKNASVDLIMEHVSMI